MSLSGTSPSLYLSGEIMRALKAKYMSYDAGDYGRLNAANIFTLARIPMAFVIPVMFILGNLMAGLVIFAIAALTDLVDGKLARLTGRDSELGTVLDPVADSILFFLTGAGALFVIDQWGFLLVALIAQVFVSILSFNKHQADDESGTTMTAKLGFTFRATGLGLMLLMVSSDKFSADERYNWTFRGGILIMAGMVLTILAAIEFLLRSPESPTS